MKKLIAIILFSTATNSMCFPWNTAGSSTLQTLRLASALMIPLGHIASLLHLRYANSCEFLKLSPLTNIPVARFVKEQLQQHGINPTTTKIFERPGKYSTAAPGNKLFGMSVIVSDELVKAIDIGLKTNPCPKTNPVLGDAAVTLAHESAHLLGHQCTLNIIGSTLVALAVYFYYKKNADAIIIRNKIDLEKMKNQKLKTTLTYLENAFCFFYPSFMAIFAGFYLNLKINHIYEYIADTYAFTHAPSPLALRAWAASINDKNNPDFQTLNNINPLLHFLFTTHPTPLSRANRALDYAQKMLKAQAAAAT